MKESFKEDLKVFTGSSKVARESIETDVYLLHNVQFISGEMIIMLH